MVDPLFTLDKTLIILGDPEVTKDQERRAYADFLKSLFKMGSALSQVMVVWLLIALTVSTIELFIGGQYTRTGSLTSLGLVVFGICILGLCTIALGIYGQSNKSDGSKKVAHTKLFIALSFVTVPLTFLVSLLCYTLGNDENLYVPWVMNFLGISDEAEDLSVYIQTDVADLDYAITSDTLSQQNASAPVYAYTAAAGVGGRVAADRETVTIDQAVFDVTEKMPLVAGVLMGVTCGLVMCIGFACQSIGGYTFLSSSICDFCAYCNLIHGVLVAFACGYLHQDTLEVKLVQLADQETSFFNTMALIAIFMIFTSLVGMLGRELACMKCLHVCGDETLAQKLLMRFYLFLLICCMILCVNFYMACFYVAENIDQIVDERWHDPDFQREKAHTIAANMTEEDFIDVVASGYNLLSLSSTITGIYIVAAVISTNYTTSHPMPKHTEALPSIDPGGRGNFDDEQISKKDQKLAKKMMKTEATDGEQVDDTVDFGNPVFDTETDSSPSPSSRRAQQQQIVAESKAKQEIHRNQM